MKTIAFKISAAIASLLAFGGLALVPVYAATTVPTSVSAKVEVKTTVSADKLAKIISRSDEAITKRIDDLNKLNDRIQAMKNVSASAKAAAAASVQTNIAGLTTLKTKIDADTDVTVAQTDEKSITGPFRIYALVIPQGYILASVDRIGTVSDLMTDLSTKLAARITAAQTAGKDVTKLQAALTDLNAKIVDAQAQAVRAEGGVSTLVPDQGDKTKLAANTAALKAARANIKTASSDLKDARKDAETIVKGLKGFGLSATASTTVTTH